MKTQYRDPLFNFFDDVFHASRQLFSPDVKVSKDENEYKLFLSVPGLTKDDLKISIIDKEMSITFDNEINNEKQYFVKGFTKKYVIPENVMEEEIDAKVENGVLFVSLPFTKRKQTQRLLSIK